jgi:uncharacterized Zn finger protein
MTRSGGFPPYGRTRRVEGGIKAQSTRGAIGESWWSKRFISVLESLALGSRLTRGRNYARVGQVLTLAVAPGQVTATVQGSRPKPYAVTIGLKALPDSTWRRVESALAEQALFSARLLAGEMPKQIEDVFAAAGAPLFPTNASQLSMRCSCPDWSVPCKHIAATFYLLAEAFDADPFQILHWRGRDREVLLDRLRALRSEEDTSQPDAEAAGAPERTARRRQRAGARGASAVTPADPNATEPLGVTGAAIALAGLAGRELEETVDRFWVSPVPLPARPPTIGTDVDLLLRQLPPPAPSLGGAQLVERLRTLYAALAPPSAT